MGDNAVVYDIKGDMKGREVAILSRLDQFMSPFDFQHTGFVYNIDKYAFETDVTATIAVQRCFVKEEMSANIVLSRGNKRQSSNKLAFRAYSEMDL